MMLMPIIIESIRADYYAILGMGSCSIGPQETLAEWRAKVSVQELQETEDHPVYTELQVKQLRIEW